MKYIIIRSWQRDKICRKRNWREYIRRCSNIINHHIKKWIGSVLVELAVQDNLMHVSVVVYSMDYNGDIVGYQIKYLGKYRLYCISTITNTYHTLSVMKLLLTCMCVDLFLVNSRHIQWYDCLTESSPILRIVKREILFTCYSICFCFLNGCLRSYKDTDMSDIWS